MADEMLETVRPTKRWLHICKLCVKMAVLVAILVWAMAYFNILPPLPLIIAKDNYQAVFLTNGQVYFGKLYRETSLYAVLREVYYLQLAQAPQPAGEGAQVSINLVKLGSELHGPEDEMRINRDHILFVEDLKADSQVVKAIKQFKQGNR
jgi:hypothetical protein